MDQSTATKLMETNLSNAKNESDVKFNKCIIID